MATQAINLECVAFALVGSFRSAKNLAGVRSGGRPLHQLLLRHKRSGIYSFGQTVSTGYCGTHGFRCYRVYFAADYADFGTDYFPEVPVLDSSSS